MGVVIFYAEDEQLAPFDRWRVHRLARFGKYLGGKEPFSNLALVLPMCDRVHNLQAAKTSLIFHRGKSRRGALSAVSVQICTFCPNPFLTETVPMKIGICAVQQASGHPTDDKSSEQISACTILRHGAVDMTPSRWK
jgi:hypothetical protein